MKKKINAIFEMLANSVRSTLENSCFLRLTNSRYYAVNHWYQSSLAATARMLCHVPQ